MVYRNITGGENSAGMSAGTAATSRRATPVTADCVDSSGADSQSAAPRLVGAHAFCRSFKYLALVFDGAGSDFCEHAFLSRQRSSPTAFAGLKDPRGLKPTPLIGSFHWTEGLRH